MLPDQRREGCHGTALGAAEDRSERCGLCVVRALVNISSKRPVAVSHGARRMADHGDVKPVERNLAVAALINVEDQRHVAHALAWPCCQRRGGRDEAGTYHVTVAVLEIVAGQTPLGFRCHFPLPASGPLPPDKDRNGRSGSRPLGHVRKPEASTVRFGVRLCQRSAQNCQADCCPTQLASGPVPG